MPFFFESKRAFVVQDFKFLVNKVLSCTSPFRTLHSTVCHMNDLYK
jgi:hypothetical protein